MDPLVNLTAAAQITSFAQLPVKRRGVLASGGQLLLQPGDERIEPAGSRCAHGPFGEALGPGEAAHGGAGQARRFFDGAQRLSGRLTAADIMGVRQRACPAGDGGILRSSGAWKGTGAHALTRRRGQRRGGQLAQPTVHSEEPAREHLADVLEQVPAVSDLHRTGRAQVHAALELAGSVARHHLDFTAARAQLGGQGLGPAVRQQVHRATALQIHEQAHLAPHPTSRTTCANAHALRLLLQARWVNQVDAFNSTAGQQMQSIHPLPSSLPHKVRKNLNTGARSIAEIMDTSMHTVKKHMTNLMVKMVAENRLVAGLQAAELLELEKS